MSELGEISYLLLLLLLEVKANTANETCFAPVCQSQVTPHYLFVATWAAPVLKGNATFLMASMKLLLLIGNSEKMQTKISADPKKSFEGNLVVDGKCQECICSTLKSQEAFIRSFLEDLIGKAMIIPPQEIFFFLSTR